MAAPTIKRGRMLSDQTFEEMFLEARKARLERRYRDAIAQCTTILGYDRLTPHQKVVTLEIRGICYTWRGQLRRAEIDIVRACSLAERYNLVAEHVHLLTSMVRLRLRQHRNWNAASEVLPRAERLLAGREDPTSMALYGAVQSLYGVLSFRNRRADRALHFFRYAATLFEKNKDQQRELRNLRRKAYVEVWCGRRRDGWNTAGQIIALARTLTEEGDRQMVRLGHYIRLCCWLPWPRMALWVVRGAAGL